MTETTTPQKPENGFVNIIVNVIVPVFILNKLSTQLGALNALILALAFPLGYGLWDLWQRKKVNYFSLLGLLNVGLTGGLAVASLDGHWFAVKEAVFPLLIGVFVLGSAFTQRPFIKTLLMNPQIMKTDVIDQKLRENNSLVEFESHLKISTYLLAGSFLISALLNYVLAIRIFKPLDPSLASEARSVALNEQIAQMTSSSFLVIMVPSMIILFGILWYLLRGIKQHTGLALEEIIRQN